MTGKQNAVRDARGAHLTVIGGGLAGLVAAIEAADRGASVRLVEAHDDVGGRGRTTPPPHVAHQGPHVFYSDGPTWAWLRDRSLLGKTASVPPASLARFGFRSGGRLVRVPPVALTRVLLDRKQAPVDSSFTDWASARWNAETAHVAAAAAGVGVFHFDPGELSAAFVQYRLRRVFSLPPHASYITGGWTSLFGRLTAEAGRLGVAIETGRRVTTLPEGIVIIATSLDAARILLGDESLAWPSGAAALVDVAVKKNRHDAFVISDLDECGWLERFTAADPSLAPPEESLVQAQVPLRPGESTASGISRVEELLDLGLPQWRDRLTWRRDSIARGRTGAIDYPGRSWRDRPAIDRGNGIYLAGDQVAAAGLLSEVSFNSAMRAVDLALVRATKMAPA
ncbi:MAG TPA: NAD(P)-binding protein [Glaciibacter sp.]|nr:NAD(P)-binding protein [Glaciibacter sp.]